MKYGKIILPILIISLCCFGCHKSKMSKISEKNDFIYSGMHGSSEMAKLIDKETASDDIKEIIDRGYLRVAMILNHSDLFVRVTEGHYDGIDVDIASNLAKRLGVDLVIDTSVTEHNDLQRLLTSDKVDLVISAYSLASYRAASIAFSDPYLENRFVFVGNQLFLSKNNIESNPINYLKSNPVRLAVIKNGSEEATARELFPKAKIVQVEFHNELNEKVVSGEVDGAITTEILCIVDNIKNPQYMIYNKTFVFEDEKDYFCVGLAPEKEGLLRFVNASLKTMHPLSIKDIEDRSKDLYGY